MKVGDLIKCALFEKNGVITSICDLSTPSSRMEAVTISWEDGKEESVNITLHPQRLVKLTENESKQIANDAFGNDLSSP